MVNNSFGPSTGRLSGPACPSGRLHGGAGGWQLRHLGGALRRRGLLGSAAGAAPRQGDLRLPGARVPAENRRRQLGDRLRLNWVPQV